MNERNKFLRSIAEQKAEQISKYPEVEAVIVAGSVSIGRADAASDIDMMVYYSDAIPEDMKRAEQEEAERTGGHIRVSHENVFIVNHVIQGALCEVAHFQRNIVEEIIDRVVEQHDTDKDNHQVVSGTLASLVLYDKGLIRGWKERLSAYPEELAVKLVEKHLRFPAKWIFYDMGIARNDLVFVADLMLKAQENIVGILCGINRMYLPGKMKGLSHPIGLMKIQPRDLLSRFTGIWQTLSRVSVDEVVRLIAETWDLVDEHMPAVSTTEARRKFESLL